MLLWIKKDYYSRWIMEIFYYIRLYGYFISLHFKKIFEYKLSFFIGIIPFILLQLSGVIVLWAIFKKVPCIVGFGFDDVLFIYGFGVICYSIGRTLFSNLNNFGYQYIIKGELDNILTKPINPLFYILAFNFSEKEIGELLVGLILVIKSIISLKIQVGILEFLLFIYFILNGVVIYGAINLLAVVVCFWIKDSRGLISPIMRLQEFSNFPITIYDKIIRFILIWVIPFAFVNFFPVTFFLGKKEFIEYIFCIPLVGIIFPMIVYLLWIRGLSKYESTGT